MEWNFQSAGELAVAFRAGEVSSVELTEAAIAGIERDDGVINAICVPDFDRAREAARHADQARVRGEDRPLLGIPVTVKESYNMAGLPTTWGMPRYRDFVPAEDAVQVSRLKAAGAVVLGKTNVPLGLQDAQSFNEIYGITNNPWDHGRTSGGSSGGSAAALASGFGALSIGSDGIAVEDGAFRKSATGSGNRKSRRRQSETIVPLMSALRPLPGPQFLCHSRLLRMSFTRTPRWRSSGTSQLNRYR